MTPPTYSVFESRSRLANGDADHAAAAAVAAYDRGAARILIFDDATGRQVEVDPRTNRLALPELVASEPPPRPGRGRPKLGVVAREVTLLPRHWDWLSAQPGGASAALRRLVDDARKTHATADAAREAQQMLYGAMSVLAGDLPGFEEASRALFAGDDPRLESLMRAWPADVADFLVALARRKAS